MSSEVSTWVSIPLNGDFAQKRVRFRVRTRSSAIASGIAKNEQCRSDGGQAKNRIQVTGILTLIGLSAVAEHHSFLAMIGLWRMTEYESCERRSTRKLD